MRRRVFILAAGLLSLLAGCATVPGDPAARAAFKENNDPLEPLNRKIFVFNQVIDRVLLKPLAQAYVKVVPAAGRDGIRNFLKNLNEPVVLANDVLQVDCRSAGRTAGRFVINSTLGLAGFIDVAGRHGLKRQIGDFGQTLHTWGFTEGPYLMLPVIGPSSPRDAVGQGVDVYLDPFRYLAKKYNYPTGVSVAKVAADGIDERSRNIDSLDELRREAIDFYASFRSLYRQNRAAELRRAGEAPAPPPVDFYSDPGAASPADGTKGEIGKPGSS